MKKQLLAALAVLAFAVGMTSSVTAANEEANQPADVNVTVASETAIDVHPQQLTYPQVNPGDTAGSSVEARGFGSIELENVGSTVIEELWVNATSTTNKLAQYGSNDPTQFNSGNFLMVRPDSADMTVLQGDDKTFNFVNRRDYAIYNDSYIPTYIHAPSDGSYYQDSGATTSGPATDVAVGRMRMGDEEYFYALPVGTNGRCNGDTANDFNTLLVAKKPHNATHTIPVDFTTDDSGPDGGGTGYDTISGRDYYIFNITGPSAAGNYGVTKTGNNPANGLNLTDPDTGQFRRYDAVPRCDTGANGHTDTDEPHVIRTRYNTEAGDWNDLADVGSGAPVITLLMGGSSNDIDPGQAVNINAQVMVPRGVPQGQVTEGKLRVVVSTDAT